MCQIVKCSEKELKQLKDFRLGLRYALEENKKSVEIPKIMNYNPSRIESPIKLPPNIRLCLLGNKMFSKTLFLIYYLKYIQKTLLLLFYQ